MVFFTECEAQNVVQDQLMLDLQGAQGRIVSIPHRIESYKIGNLHVRELEFYRFEEVVE